MYYPFADAIARRYIDHANSFMQIRYPNLNVFATTTLFFAASHYLQV